MRSVFLVLLSLSAPIGALALTWDFDDGTTAGWTAHDTFGYKLETSNSTTVYNEVEDGVWRIAPVPDTQLQAISLISPLIGADSALFDRITLRLRIVHDRPTEGTLLMAWSNGESRRLKQEDPHRLDALGGFYMARLQQYPVEWEQITIDIRALEAAAEERHDEAIASLGSGFEITWQDSLFHLQFELDLNSKDMAQHLAFVEVDWIELTGAEELLLGELSPRAIVVEGGSPGTLFAPPRFSVLGAGIGNVFSSGALGDVDGDGDADLVVAWNHFMFSPVTEQTFETTEEAGWTIASSDGLGGLVPTQKELLSSGGGKITGDDLNGDGLLDLAFRDGLTTELWLNRGEDGFETVLQLSNVFFEGLVDGDGDGDVDLLVSEYDDSRHDLVISEIIMWLNDGAAGFAHSDRFALDTDDKLAPRLLAGQPAGAAARVLWTRRCYEAQEPWQWQVNQPWSARASPLFFETSISPCELSLHLLSDLDGDGTIELIGTPERDLFFDFLPGSTEHGLALWQVAASGAVERHRLLGPQVIVQDLNGDRGEIIAHDLNGDGLLDLALVDVNVTTGPALIVLVGQPDGVPVVEGRYPLPGVGSQVFAGDVNGDGAADIVVLGSSIEGGDGGAFVFLNQGRPATAIATETTATPADFALGVNYPNPFNPATIIPVSVAADAEEVAVTIYNVLGQPVRQVWQGRLTAGEHRLGWDGLDEQGQAVAAGIYVVQMRQGQQTYTRKMVKLE